MSQSNVPPPPPPPGGGYPPPGGMPPPPGGYPPYSGQAGGFSIGNAFNYGWSKFTQNLGPIALVVLLLIVVGAVLQVIQYLITAGMDAAERGSALSFGVLSVSLLFSLLTTVIGWVIQAAIVKGALDITHGRKLDIGTMFSGIDYAQVILAALIVGVATVIGLALCIIPGLVVIFFSAYTNYFIIDQRMSAVDAIKASFGFVNRYLGTLVGFFLACLVAVIIGALLCLVGLLVAIPVVIIAQAYTFRTLRGEPVAP
jgi:uncharacterized membrane protein